MSDKKLLCQSCIHEEVCKYKDKMITVCHEADNIDQKIHEEYVEGTEADGVIITNTAADCSLYKKYVLERGER